MNNMLDAVDVLDVPGRRHRVVVAPLAVEVGAALEHVLPGAELCPRLRLRTRAARAPALSLGRVFLARLLRPSAALACA